MAGSISKVCVCGGEGDKSNDQIFFLILPLQTGDEQKKEFTRPHAATLSSFKYIHHSCTCTLIIV